MAPAALGTAGGADTGDGPDGDGGAGGDTDADAVARLTGSAAVGGIGARETSDEVSTVTSMGMGRPQTCVIAAPMGARACSTMSLAKAEPTTRTRVPSTSMRWVMRIMDILPWPSSPELESTSRAESHLVLAASGTTDS
ncbi:hypothetical protein HMPREF9056_00702 [Actinomyces sp. oral taxon 170 str. F0386]|nr:hypothetical protein HMPREF9056_00702 [Actinomyces sp. oral taxon 170 str. F0386]